MAILGVLYYGGYMVINGKLTTGQLSSFIMYTITMSVGLLSVGGNYLAIKRYIKIIYKLGITN